MMPLADDLRSAARARAAVLGLPTSRLEDFRYVRCEPMAAPPAAGKPVPRDAVAQWIGAGPGLAIVDGFALPGPGDWPAPWRLALPEADDLQRLQAGFAAEQDPTALWPIADGGCMQALHVTGRHDRPLRLAHVAGGGRSGWHLAIDLAPGAALDLAILHAAIAPARASCAIRIRLGAGARLRVDEVQATAWAQLLRHAHVILDRDASCTWTWAGSGGDLVRVRTAADLDGPGASCAYAAVDAVSGADQAHQVTRFTHRAGQAASQQLVKTVLRDRSRASFDGLVSVLPGADGTDAEQQNRNLLLSDQARADTRPQLDIKADEVKAAHGATVGRLDEEELRYLAFRGLGPDEARSILASAYVHEVTAAFADPALRALAEQRLLGTA